jgi:hypothetical protein
MNAKKAKKAKALHRGKKLAAKKPLASGKYIQVPIESPLISS